jgi:hypothetical protein
MATKMISYSIFGRSPIISNGAFKVVTARFYPFYCCMGLGDFFSPVEKL